MWEPGGTARRPSTTAKQPEKSRISVKMTTYMVLDRSRYGPIIKLVGLANVQAMNIMFYVYDCKTAGFKQPLGTVQL